MDPVGPNWPDPSVGIAVGVATEGLTPAVVVGVASDGPAVVLGLATPPPQPNAVSIATMPATPSGRGTYRRALSRVRSPAYPS